MDNKVITRVQTLEDIWNDNLAFVIPSYQRPYVWPDDDVLKLFDDIIAAKNSGESHYYIGTVLTAVVSTDQVQKNQVHELIDGQQRTTTLMLMALAFRAKGGDTPLAQLAILNNQPRLTFAIRDQVQALLGHWAGLHDYQYPGDEAVDHNPYLIRLNSVLRALQQKLEKLSSADRIEIAEYIFSQVQWVNNVMPDGMDLNRLFATMNTSGIQLEQTDILKSFLFKQITTDKMRYEAVWQACEHMENYFERNVRKLFPGTNWQAIQPEDLSKFNAERFILTTSDTTKNHQGRSIAELAVDMHEISVKSNSDQNSEEPALDDEGVYCRSIISFPLLLIHAYRIYRQQQGDVDIDVRLHADRLIESFQSLTQSPEDKVKEFFECLWTVRYQFDRWVVKWVELAEGNEEQLRLTSVSRSQSNGNWYINRSAEEVSELVLLQSVRYFTGERSAQYWLTPYLGWLVRSTFSNKKVMLKELERIDNQLSCAEITQKDASYALLSGDLPTLKSIETISSYLFDPQGTRFEHYWFQKVEYLLWKHRYDYLDSNSRQLAGYRITSKNSVEHVHPQNEEMGKQLPDEFLHAFGNLVLLSPGQNSSYSNQTVRKKEADFVGKPVYDSLKLAHIFSIMKEKGNWDKISITIHEKKMLDLVRFHYTDTPLEEGASFDIDS